MAEISDKTYEQLRRILEGQNRHAYTFEEARAIGDGLLDFYALLMQLEEAAAQSSGGQDT